MGPLLLKLLDFPRVKVGPENPLRVEKGTPARLTCNVDSKPAVSSVRWTRNGRFSETSFTYTIPRVSLQVRSGSIVHTVRTIDH